MNIENNYENKQEKCKGCKLFFASETFLGYCSSCFKKEHGNIEKPIEKALDVQVEIPSPLCALKEEPHEVNSEQVDRKKCFDCKKKVGNLGTECKCGFVFCNRHKMPEDHKCSINFVELAAKKLTKDLVKVSHKKIGKIE